MNAMSITALFVCLDDFAILFEQWQRHHMIPSERKRFRQGKLSLGECMFIMALFHCSPYSNFKRFRKHGVEGVCRGHFGDLPCYGRFFGLKLHVVVNSKGQFMAMRTTPGNTDDRTQVEALTQGQDLWRQGIHFQEAVPEALQARVKLVTSIRHNMINYLMPLEDKLLLRQRRVIETLFGRLKEGKRRRDCCAEFWQGGFKPANFQPSGQTDIAMQR